MRGADCSVGLSRDMLALLSRRATSYISAPSSFWAPSSTLSILRSTRLQQHSRELASSTSAPAQSIKSARREILGHWSKEVIKYAKFSALKILRRRGFTKGDRIADHYPTPHPFFKHPLVRQTMNEKRLAEVERRRALGQGPPPKGQGKRAKQKK